MKWKWKTRNTYYNKLIKQSNNLKNKIMSRGTSNSLQESAIFISVHKAMFAQRVKEATATSFQRALEKGPNKGQMINEEKYNQIEGALVDIKAESSDCGMQWVFKLDISTEQNPDKKAILTLGISSSYASNIIMKLPNLDLKKDILFNVYSFKDKEKNKDVSGINLRQNGAKIENYFTKEVPNGMPELEYNKIKNEWNDTKRLEFFMELVLKYFPKVDAEPVATTATAPANETPFASNEAATKKSGLPF